MRLSTHGNIGNIGTIMYSRLLAFAFSLFATLPAQAGVLDDVKASGELKVCIWPDYYGISYRNPRTGTLQGIDIDLSLALAKDLGVRLVHIETSFNTLIDDLIAGKCQIGMMGIGVTPERKQQLAFSLPYLRSDIYAITTRDNATLKTWADIDRPGRSIAVQKGTYMESLMRRTLAHARLIVTERPGEREREVSSGRATRSSPTTPTASACSPAPTGPGASNPPRRYSSRTTRTPSPRATRPGSPGSTSSSPGSRPTGACAARPKDIS